MYELPERRPVRSKAAARRAAESIATRLCDDFPVHPVEIAEKLGVNVIAGPDTGNGLSGALVIRGGQAVIVYNSSDPLVRRRFTVAHELGHYVLHTAPDIDAVLFRDDRSSKGTSVKEIQANAFAAALLMPEHLVRERISGPIPSIHNDDIDLWARRFKVSSQAMAYRLMDLGLYTPLY